MTRWRLICEDGAGAAGGLATDEMLAQRAGEGTSPPTLRLYTYRAHCALVGRFQDVEHEVDVGFCAANGIEINRRPTGGGAILMGPDQLGVALALRWREEGSTRELMARFAEGLIRALVDLGIDARVRGKNDLEVEGRKIAGLGLHREPSAGLLFHASLLVDLDVALMLRVLKTPLEKITDKEVATVAGRTATVRRVLGRAISLDEVRERVARGFDVDLVPGTLDAVEREAVASLERAKYRSAEWIEQRTQVPDVTGATVVKAPGGLLDVRVAMAGNTLKSVHVRGDFFASERAIADLEGSLRWHSSDPDSIAATVRAVWQRHPDPGTLTAEMLSGAIIAAVERPYGCFVSPGGHT